MKIEIAEYETKLKLSDALETQLAIFSILQACWLNFAERLFYKMFLNSSNLAIY